MLGVSGIRGIVGETMTPQVAGEAACAFAAHLGRQGSVVVGRDSRPSGPAIASAVTAGLLAGGCHVVDAGIVTTPGLGLTVRQLGASGGLMVTASHNPKQWNGIKFLTGGGRAPSDDEAREILDRFQRRDFGPLDTAARGGVETDTSADRRHVEAVLAVVDAGAIRRRAYRVVLDSVNGAGGASGRLLLEALGCRVVHLNAEPSGEFAHQPEPLAENLTDLAEATGREQADIGFAQDPDGDRLAMVDERGRYIGEEYTLAIAVRAVLEGATARAEARGSRRLQCMVANLSTSRMIDDLATEAGPDWTVHRTPVGEAHVVQGMFAHDAMIGGEGNGGVIDPRVGLVRDSLAAMALALEHMARTGLSLSQIVGRMPTYHMLKTKMPCDRSSVAARLQQLRERFAGQKINTADGVRIDWPEGWVHVRASNTEPVMRVIAEATDEPTAAMLVGRVREAIERS